MRFGRRRKGIRAVRPWRPTFDKSLFRDGFLLSAGCLFRDSSLALSFLVAFQLLGEAPAFAEWQVVDGNDKTTVYLDSETISRNGEMVRVLVLDDLKTPHTRGFSKFLSVRAQEEHDCAKERFRLLSLEQFSGNMGAGDVIYSKSGESGWSPIPRGTLAQSVWKVVCGKK